MKPVLLPLYPIGIGGADSESFASYYARLARLHNISQRNLADFLTSWISAQSGRTYKLYHTPLYDSGGTGLSGFGERVKEYIRVVEVAGGLSNLQRCSFIPISPAINKACIGAIRIVRGWCEQCFRDDLRTDSGPYDRMLWTLMAIERCPVHKVRLRTKCPSCSVEQRFHHRIGGPGICWKCTASLVGPPSQLEPMLHPAFGEKDACELVAAISSGQLDNVRSNAFGAFQSTLEAIVSPLAPIIRSIAEISGIARRDNIDVRPNIGTLFRKAQAAGVSIVRILQDPESAAHEAGQLIFDKKLIGAKARARHPATVRKEVEVALRRHLRKPLSEQIPTLQEIAEPCAVSEGYVRHHLPKLVKKYQVHRMAASIHKTRSDCYKCLAFLDGLLERAPGVSAAATRKKLARTMAAEIGCSINVAASAIRIKFDGAHGGIGGMRGARPAVQRVNSLV